MYIEKRTGTFCVLLQKNETFSRSFMFFAKERCNLCVLFSSLEKNGKECMHRSFMFHKSPKPQKKNGKECCIL